MGEATRIQHDRVRLGRGLMQRVDELALVIALHSHELDAEFRRHSLEARMDLSERRVAVDFRLSRSQQVQVRATQDKHSHPRPPPFYSPADLDFRQASKCSPMI